MHPDDDEHGATHRLGALGEEEAVQLRCLHAGHAAFDGVGEGVTEAGAGILGEHEEAPRLGVVVVGGVHRSVQHLLDELTGGRIGAHLATATTGLNGIEHRHGLSP